MRPSITINIEPMLQDFLYHEFGACADDGIEISACNEIGRYIQSMITVADRPPKQEIKDNPMTIYLPVRSWNHFIFRENFIYVPEWKQEMIRSYVKASFRLKLREFFLTGYEKGFSQDQLIKSFLSAYNIKRNAISYDAVKKCDYRNRSKIIEEVKNEVQLSLF